MAEPLVDPADCEHGRWNPDNDQCLDCGDPSPAAPYPSDPDRSLVHFLPAAVSLTACGKVPTWAIAGTADGDLVTCPACVAAVQKNN